MRGTGPVNTGTQPERSAASAVEGRANWLRAGVLGANDGIVSVAAIVVGVAGATASTASIAVAGLAALIGGAVSMSLGEYVSVSSQRDTELASADSTGSSAANPWVAAAASATSFISGGVLPLAAMILSSSAVRIPLTVVVVVAALALAGGLSAHLGGFRPARTIIRTVVGGGLALLLTYLIGGVFHIGGVTT